VPGAVPPVPPRLGRLFEHAPDVDAILVINDPPDATFQWATGLHHGGTFEGSAVILREGETPQVLVPPLEETTARKGIGEVVVFSGKRGFQEALAGALGGAGKVGLHHQRVTLARKEKLEKALPKTSFVDVSDAIGRARLVKDADEIEAMRAACELTDRIADHMEDHVAPAETESGLAAGIVREILAQGAGISFDPIVAWGPGSAEPHYAPQPVPLRDGPLLVDMGAKLNGYCSDITRTYTLGPPSGGFREMYDTVDHALEAALDTIRPGVKGGQVHKAAEKVIDASRFKGRFIHSVGHSLGVEVHDGGRLHPSQDLTLEEGMVFTVEPGVYVPGEAGVRLEEDVVVTRNGYTKLTQADRELRDLTR
ncbi:MAG: Xaa-Pro peptidase family protein, partial [Candidatus Thermoplasmatota archaeon]|nr:Xaa-Pro peptidase family protein [Candidatus Thermoplasmatota archaeon]